MALINVIFYFFQMLYIKTRQNDNFKLKFVNAQFVQHIIQKNDYV